MIEFIVQHPIQSVIIVFSIMFLLARVEIWFRRKFSNQQTACSDGMTVIQVGDTIEITNDRGTRIVVQGKRGDSITVNGKSIDA